MYGDDFHPIMKMAENCSTIQKIADEAMQDTSEPNDDDPIDTTAKKVNLAKLANENWEKLAPYIAPKLKAIEISGDPDNPLEIIACELSGTERAARIAALLNRVRTRRDGHTIDGGLTDLDELTGTTSDGSD